MAKMSSKLVVIAVIVVLAVVALVGIFSPRGQSEEIVIYSGRREQFVSPLLEDFERQTGIRVRLLSGSATSYAHRIVEERRRPLADLFLANDAGVMEYLRLQGVLRPIESPALEKLPEGFRAEDGSWTGLSARARVLMYNRELIDEDDMPHSVFDLADPSYRGRFAMTRAGNSSLISHMAAIRAHHGDERMRDFVRGVLNNDPVITSGHTDIRRMVGAGEVAFGLVNCYYYRLQLGEPRNNDVGAVYPDQDPGGSGVFVNVAGAALIAGSPNQDNASKLMEFLLEDRQLHRFAELSKETHILPDETASHDGRRLDDFRSMDMPLSDLGKVWEDTLDAMEAAGFTQ